ncbi:SDR family oxidoreductase [Dactylosporangium sp. CA-139066]|uniref:SDR family oxidoreductase n=1 Tax=Dactylosporangium sp. CA-139066 TaxID=3239930 RepID=UPI003D94CDAB
MNTILVTGATGTLGRPLMRELSARHLDARGLSRRAPGHAHADLLTGEGLAAALDGVGLVIHAATDGRRDVRAAENLLGAMRPGQHILYVSIVGVDRVPLPYYRQKYEIETMVRSRGGSILRATQFHDLVFTMARALTAAPVGLYPSCSVQPVEVGEVATRLAEVAATLAADPSPVVEDFGGPEVRHGRDVIRAYTKAAGRRRVLLPLRVPGRIFRAYRDGGHLAPDRALGTRTWEDYLAGRFASGS